MIEKIDDLLSEIREIDIVHTSCISLETKEALLTKHRDEVIDPLLKSLGLTVKCEDSLEGYITAMTKLGNELGTIEEEGAVGYKRNNILDR